MSYLGYLKKVNSQTKALSLILKKDESYHQFYREIYNDILIRGFFIFPRGILKDSIQKTTFKNYTRQDELFRSSL